MVAQRNNIHFAIHHGAVMSHGVYPVKWIQSTRWQYGRQTDASERAWWCAESERDRGSRENLSCWSVIEWWRVRVRKRGRTEMIQLLCYTHLEEITHDVNAQGDRATFGLLANDKPPLWRAVDFRIGVRDIDINPGNEVADLESKLSSSTVVAIVVVWFGTRSMRGIVSLIILLTYKGVLVATQILRNNAGTRRRDEDKLFIKARLSVFLEYTWLQERSAVCKHMC